jgi:regulator of protease activity HflC (stomatin/prohibitin superfamily)
MKTILLTLAAILAVGCGRIETGHVGVRTDFNKTIEREELQPGWYGAVFTSVDEFVIKETEMAMDDMKPKAKDNLSLRDMDVSVFYTVNPGMVADLLVKYSSMSVKGGDGNWYPAFSLVERVTRGATYDATAQFDSLTIHSRRSDLEAAIHERVQSELDKGDKDVFKVTKVIVRQVVTDPALEQAIQQSVQVQKQIEAKRGQIDLAKAEAERQRVEAGGIAKANRILAESLTDQFIRYKQVEALFSFAGEGTHTVLLQPGSQPLVNVGK